MVVANYEEKPRDLDSEYERLHRNIGLTIGARFNAFRRHRNRNRTSLVAIIILSSYALLFSMVASFLEIGNKQAVKELSLLSVFMSVLIITFSLFESSKRHDARAELFAKSALQLGELRDKIAVSVACGEKSKEILSGYLSAYHDILHTFGDSHAEIDFKMHLAILDSKNGVRNKLLKIINIINIWAMPLIALASPFVLFLLVVGGRNVYVWYIRFIAEMNFLP